MEKMMIIDVLINSCARPDVLENSIFSFKKYIKTIHNFRYVILEDKVDNRERQQLGRNWINDHKYLFDEIHYSHKRMGPGFFFAPIVELCKSEYFFHLEDDNLFFKDIFIDPIIDIMKVNNNILEVILRRGKTDKRNNPKNIKINDLELTEFDLFSVSTGIFNTKLVNDVLDKTGRTTQLREVHILKPASIELGVKKYTLGYNTNDVDYKHVGIDKNYRKGAWKI
jgi:hypothetical protein